MRISLGVLVAVVLWIGVVFTLVGEVDTTPNFTFGFLTHQWSSLKSMVGVQAAQMSNLASVQTCPGERDEHYAAAENSKVMIGMTPCLVRLAWGKPDEVEDGTLEQPSSTNWIFDRGTIRFEDDRVIAVHER